MLSATEPDLVLEMSDVWYLRLFQASGQVSQRVYLATRSFSNTVAHAMRSLLPRRAAQAKAVQTIDAWFDVHNSRAPYDAKDERCAYGVNPTIKTRQDEALAAMDRLIQTAKKVSKKHPSGRSAPLPCQRGVQRSNASLRGLLVDVRAACPDVRYIMTSHVIQDCVENAFSQMRSMCGSNTTPDAVEPRVRLRIMLMAPGADAPGCRAESGLPGGDRATDRLPHHWRAAPAGDRQHHQRRL